jgi:uncharacterized membrane protein YfcA
VILASPWAYVLLAAVAFVASVLNVVSGGGSFLTLPVLLFLGIPAVEANATNRIGVIAQNAAATWAFHREGVLDWKWALGASVPALVGAVAGAWLALDVPDRDFRRILAVLMVLLTLWTVIDPIKRASRTTVRSPWSLGVAAGMFVSGLYGGFVQAGVGFLVVAVTTMAGIDLLRGAAVKVVAIGFVTVAAAIVFAWHGTIQWPAGLALSLGSLAGGEAGVRLAVLKGQRWLQHAVTCTVIAFAVLLWVV